MGNELFGMFQLVVVMAYLVSVIVTVTVYSTRRARCAEGDGDCIIRLNNEFLPAWIVIGVLAILLLFSLWIACFAGNAGSCFIAVVWTLFGNHL